MHKPHFLLVAPFPGVFIRRSVAYWVLLHLLRDVMMLFMADALPIRPADLLPGGNPLVTWLHSGTTRPLGTPESAARDWLFRRDYLGVRAV